ncbi:hypothetical protein VCRA2128O102_50244 [Vibrio crassostreae]|nr:hypothetical protein VCRA2126O86_50242 [Vibrio crassostreae]CAK3047652.1 hypothetical protein VCRA2125O83_50244 [Vibrio crassostreae]CAK3050096.1 hypothetical protein VCRA2127O91_50243 [Vibrio crassostreae]CAK3540212.1 hypothetical protein VCRA2128O102_50244 [Vibrio crassostreae]CAK3565387.1 hypothetical protein VCRA2125O80_40242 [Vibrio crassostreae]
MPQRVIGLLSITATIASPSTLFLNNYGLSAYPLFKPLENRR